MRETLPWRPWDPLGGCEDPHTEAGGIHPGAMGTLTRRDVWGPPSHGGGCGVLPHTKPVENPPRGHGNPHTERCVGVLPHTEGCVGPSLTQRLWGILPGATGTFTRRDVWGLPSHPGVCGTLPHAEAEGNPPRGHGNHNTEECVGPSLIWRCVWVPPAHGGV